MKMSSAELVAAIATSYLGTTKRSEKHKEIINAFNSAKPDGYTAKLSDAWCAEAWTAFQIMAGNNQKEVPMSCNCNTIIAKAKNMSEWKEDESIVPKIGWGCLYDWQDGKNYKNYNNKGSADHIGTIVDVDSKYIYVVEGNMGSNSVCGKRAVLKNGRFLRGFVAPNYTKLSQVNHKPTTPYSGKLPKNDVQYGASGSDVKKVQTFLNWILGYKLDCDGNAGRKTIQAVIDYQYAYGLVTDGIFGPKCRKKAQANVDTYKSMFSPPTASKPVVKKDKLQPWYDAMTTQFNWSKNQKYKFNDHPTVANSREEGTCITFVAVALQRLGLLPKGKYFYFYPKTKRIAGNAVQYVKDHPEIFKVSYPNKTIKSLWKEGKIKKGDIVGYDNPAYHTMVFMGYNSKGKPIFNTMGHVKKIKGTYPAYANRKVAMIVHLNKVA